MIVWTHRYDLLAKVVAGVVWFVAMLAIEPESRLPAGTDASVVDAAVFASVIVVMGAVWLLLWRPLLRPLSTWAYVARTFEVRPSWSEAHELSRLFALELSEGLRWHPSTDVAELDPSERLPALLGRADALRRAQAVGFWERTRVQSLLGRLLHPDTYVAWNVVMILGLVPIAFGALLQVGPAAFLAVWTADADGDYVPMGSLLIGMLPWALVTWVAAYGIDRLRGRPPAPPGTPDAHAG